MNVTKRVRCFFRLNSAWAQCSAVCMGLAIFIRAVYYFGIMNFNDLTGPVLTVHVILPVVLSAVYLIMLRGLRLNSTFLMGLVACAYAVSYLFITDGTGTAVIGALLLIATAALLIVTGMGMIPTRLPLLLAALATLLYRVIVIDWMHWIQAPGGFRFLDYLPELSNFFGLFAILVMCPSVRIVPVQRTMPRQETPDEPDLDDEPEEDAVPVPVPVDIDSSEEEEPIPSEPEVEFDLLKKKTAAISGDDDDDESDVDDEPDDEPEVEVIDEPDDSSDSSYDDDSDDSSDDD